MSKLIEFIHELHTLAGIESPKHPLFSIHRIENLRKLSTSFPLKFAYSFYGLALKKNLTGYIKYGRTNYDFQEGVLGFTEPYQVIEFNKDIIDHASGWMLFFHKDLLSGTALNSKIDTYGFFKYYTNEGLHLSKDEEDSVSNVFLNIEREYKKPLDKYSKALVISNLELLLTYSHRYYERQFIVRNEIDSGILSKFQKHLKTFFQENKNNGLPTVELLANELCISANYLSDYLKSTTGKSAIDHIHDKIIETAKKDLLITDKSISEIAFMLGFDYPHYFSRIFKKKTGLTPTEFRNTSE